MKIRTNSLKSRLLSGILALGMIISSCPVTTYAEDDNILPDSTTIVVDDDNLDVDVTVDESTTDDNVNSIPTDEDAVVEDVVDDKDEPPKSNAVSDNSTTDDSTDDDVTVTDPKDDVTDEDDTDIPTDDEDIDVTEDDESEEVTDESEDNTEDSTESEVVADESEKEDTNEIIVFDHYYSDVDNNMVLTSDLLVQTSDPSVFTKNTNVVSNYDDMYVISCASIQEARYVYSYYVNKVTNITDMANVLSIAEDVDDTADLSEVNTNATDAIATLNEIDTSKDLSGYIALIDTGADADINYSVLGEDTSDSNGHGTRMLNYIKEENPDAKVVSIKVFEGSKTSAADVYAGIKLAIEHNVSVINLSLVGANLEKNAIVKDVINEALDKGITVIGAAGNYNVSAKNYIPGCVYRVITVGAANADETKYSSSNYDADLYVVATSTSEAAARYTGIYTANKDSDKVFETLSDLPTDDNTTDTHDDKKSHKRREVILALKLSLVLEKV